jgi:AcrR family transcriptional regulator
MTAARWARHKQRTRDAINGAAMQLFFDRGFDAVTVADIAKQAGVSVGTVFNYFDTKEDVFFDETETLADDLVSTVRECPRGASIVDALRAHITYQLTGGRTSRHYREVGRFHAVIDASPRLQRYEHTVGQYRRRRLAAALAEALGRQPGSLHAEFAAAQYLTIEHLVALQLRRRILAGTATGTALNQLGPQIDGLFADMRDGLGALERS